MKAHPSRKRGRPRKFSDPSRVVALTLPEHAIQSLKKLNRDVAWAIVSLLGHGRSRGAVARPAADVELIEIADRRSLIVINQNVVKRIPGIHVIPLNEERSFLALESGQGVADLELAVVDRLENPALGGRERQALNELRTRLRRWRRDRGLRMQIRSIIIVEHAGRRN